MSGQRVAHWLNWQNKKVNSLVWGPGSACRGRARGQATQHFLPRQLVSWEMVGQGGLTNFPALGPQLRAAVTDNQQSRGVISDRTLRQHHASLVSRLASELRQQTGALTGEHSSSQGGERAPLFSQEGKGSRSNFPSGSGTRPAAGVSSSVLARAFPMSTARD